MASKVPAKVPYTAYGVVARFKLLMWAKSESEFFRL